MQYIERNKKVVIFFVLVIFLASAFVWRAGSSELISEAPNNTSADVVSKHLRLEGNHPESPLRQQKIVSETEKTPSLGSSSSVGKIKPVPELFSAAPIDSFDILDDAPDYSESISMDMAAFRQVKIGDSFSLPVSNNTLTLTTSDVKYHKNGGMRVKLQVDNYSSVYRAVFSIGEHVTTGKIITPTASYSLKLVDGSGWVVDRSLIDHASTCQDQSHNHN